MKPILLGVPWDAHSSFARGPALAPPAIRAALHSPSSNSAAEDEQDAVGVIEDRGDLALHDVTDVAAAIEAGAGEVVAAGGLPIFLGGDHAVTPPLVRAMHAQHGPLTILHIDAHPDLYDELDGSRDSHACPFARVLEAGLATRLVQVGIRTMNAHQRAQATRFGVETIPMHAGFAAALAAVRTLGGPLYVSLDLDAMDPSAVPGINHPEPGGFTVREVISLLGAIPPRALRGADVVELNPLHDWRDFTARVAAKLVKELVRVGRA